MQIYKVDFKNNIPEKATAVRKSYYKELTKIEKAGAKTLLKWLYVHADNQGQAIESANNFKNAILSQAK